MASTGFFNPFLSGNGGGESPSSANKISYNNTTSGLQAHNVQTAIDEVVNVLDEINSQILKTDTIGYYLSPDLWEGDLYKIQSEKIKDNIFISLDLARGITQEEYDELAAAKIINTEQTDGEIVIKALGEIPSITIPIAITFFSKEN